MILENMHMNFCVADRGGARARVESLASSFSDFGCGLGTPPEFPEPGVVGDN